MKSPFPFLLFILLFAVTAFQEKPLQAQDADTGQTAPVMQVVNETELPLALTPSPLDETWSRSWWMPRHAAKLADSSRVPAKLLFIGDSITQGWEGQGAEVWEEYYSNRQAFNLGYSGDRTENVLWRLENGEVDGMNPDLVVMMIGTNNTGHRQDPAEITALGVETILDELEVRLPDSDILLLAVFPRGATPDDSLRQLNNEINSRIAEFADNEQVFFLNINDVFLDAEGNLSADIMPDMLHPNEYGYQLWAEAMEPALNDLLAQASRPASVTPEPRDSDWWTARHDAIIADGNRAATQLLFIGDSITHWWERQGSEVWEEYYEDRRPFNLGYSGDRTEHVLWRLQNGEIDDMNPNLVVMMIGTNNTGSRQDPEDVALGIRTILDELEMRLPESEVLLLGIFPRGATVDDPLRRANSEINELIAEFEDGERVFYLNINDAFLDDEGNLPEDIMPDRLHPNEYGYQLWAEAMESTLVELLGSE